MTGEIIWDTKSTNVRLWISSRMSLFVGRMTGRMLFVIFFFQGMSPFLTLLLLIVCRNACILLCAFELLAYMRLVGHPLIHLAYAFEMSSREIAMEALALTATCYGDIHKYIDDSSYSLAEPSYRSNSLFEILNRVRSDKRFDGLFGTPGNNNLDIVFRDREAALLDHWNAWNIQNPTAQFRESQDLAAALLVATHTTDKYDFFFVHVLTTSHAIRVLLPLIPARFQIPLVRQWWLVTVAIYISQLRPEIDLDRIKSYELNGRDWDWAAGKAVKGDYYTDAHYVKAIRAFGEAARTWGDPEKRYLKAAVKFAEEFDGWGGFV
ncbi:hypothetical protein MAP00_008382 [Monascus purpureus]|nr:hypothetical protein MAP00_008382 [Monascus purpureus]